MNEWGTVRRVASALIAVSLVGCSGMGSMASTSAFDQLGGMSGVNKLASGLVNSSVSDPRLSGLTAGKSVDTAASTSKVSNQLCAMLGGGCTAPMSDDQLSSAANKLTPDQSKALTDNFSSTLNGMTSNPMVRDTVTKALGSKLGGLGGLL